ncbi:MAG: hypothetical protein ABJ024_09615 [Lentilitoribacter sp.]
MMFGKFIEKLRQSRRAKSIQKDKLAFLNAQPLLHDDLPYINVADREGLLHNNSYYAGVLNSFNPLRFFEHMQKTEKLHTRHEH